jgi:flavin-dependent dehydrogenase
VGFRTGGAGGRFRTAIIGGGPAGAFCAIWLARLAREANRDLVITVFDHKSFEQPGPAGCNMCAGVIPASLVQNLGSLSIELPEQVIQRRIEGYHLHVRGGAIDLPTPPGSTFATFRGPGPLGMYPAAQEGFDWWVLSEAQRAGATHLAQFVTDVRPPAHRRAPFEITCRDGSEHEAEFVVGAFGVNSILTRTFEQMGFGYQAPRTVRARQAEIPVEAEFIERVLRNRVVILAMGRPGLRFVAITPKRQHVTITLIGDNPSREVLDEVLDSHEVRRHFPTGWRPPATYCTCTPRMPVTAARNPVGERVIVVGDANVSRYLKNGIESSYYTGMWAAQAIASGISQETLRRAYLPRCDRAYVRDNRWGRLLFGLHGIVSRSALITRAHLSVMHQEQAGETPGRPLSEALLGLFTGGMPYGTAIRRALNPGLQWRLTKALVLTALGRTPSGERVDQIAAAGHGPAHLGPVDSSHRVVVIGGGPAGATCAIALARQGAARGRAPHVVLVEAKRFGEHQNQCAGLLSPPGPDLLAEVLGGPLPERIAQRRIAGYVLHGNARELPLDGAEHGESPTALRRVELDALLLETAQAAGVEVMQARATGLEVLADGVVVYTDGDSIRGDAVVGAFGLDETMARAFSRRTRYRPPASLDTLACKLHPAGLEFIPDLLDNCVHVFLPRLPGVEFGTLIPKGNHITVVIAGAKLTSSHMDRFLADRAVARLLPQGAEARDYFRGGFPLGPARGVYGDRYVVIGDAAGLVRPFKGKGINCALEGGVQCARAMLEGGLSGHVLSRVAESQRDLVRDAGYGRLVRWMVRLAERFDLLDPVIEAAGHSAPLQQALFDCISGRTTYREVVLRRTNLAWLLPTARRCAARVVGRDRSRP